MKMKKIFLSLLTVWTISLGMLGQVTIGTGTPPLDGVVLDLKEWEDQTGNANSTRGVTVPRVFLTDINNLFPMLTGMESDYEISKRSHIGMVVYNMNITAPFEKGLYVWNGVKWVRNILANNGLSMSQDTVQMGGDLIQNTAINLGSYNLNFSNSVGATGNVGIGTSSTAVPVAKLEVNGTVKVDSTLTAGGIFILDSVTKALPANSVSLLVRDNNTGVVFSVGTNGNSKPFSYLIYKITCANSSGNYDWIRDFDTKIPSSDYTLIVVGAAYATSTTAESPTTGLKMTSASSTYNSNNATFGPQNVYAFQNGGTWHLYADYANATAANNQAGIWSIYCMAVNNSMVQILNSGNPIEFQMGGQSGSALAPPAGL
jgi:hypothetical protein